MVGERVALGPLSRELLPDYERWLNDIQTQSWAGYPGRPEPWAHERMANWYERAATDREMMWFTIYETSQWRALGFCLLRDIDQRHGTAEFGITIGDQEERGKGYGTEAVKLLLDLSFTGLGLRNLLLSVYAFNHGAVRAYERAGFKEIGRRRGAYFMGGRAWDVIYMDCIAEEFESPVLSRVLNVEPSR